MLKRSPMSTRAGSAAPNAARDVPQVQLGDAQQLHRPRAYRWKIELSAQFGAPFESVTSRLKLAPMVRGHPSEEQRRRGAGRIARRTQQIQSVGHVPAAVGVAAGAHHGAAAIKQRHPFSDTVAQFASKSDAVVQKPDGGGAVTLVGGQPRSAVHGDHKF